MIQLLEQAKCGIEILFQGEEEWFDLQNLKVRDPDFRKLLKDRRYRLQSLVINETPNRDAMLLSFLWQLSRRKNRAAPQSNDALRVLFDKHFQESAYQKWFDPKALV